ncbi:hypothetical protein BLOT_006565 [Blomia tropicalis]|nr:hypothetical protein BLOT_006565 [Blomia tropicalis]
MFEKRKNRCAIDIKQRRQANNKNIFDLNEEMKQIENSKLTKQITFKPNYYRLLSFLFNLYKQLTIMRHLMFQQKSLLDSNTIIRMETRTNSKL